MAAKTQKPEDASELEKRIDRMMDLHPAGNAKPSSDPQKNTPDDLPEIDIFKDRPETKQAIVPNQKNTEPSDEQITQDSSVDDAAIDPLVDDIVAREGDEVLAASDAKSDNTFTPDKPSWKDRLKDALRSWWANKWARYGTLAAAAIILIGIGAIPASRYYVLNTAGVRVSATMKVLDSTTNLPLRNVTVAIGETSAKTNQDGMVRLQGLRLGRQELNVTQLGFARVSRQVTIGFGSNPLGETGLRAVGVQYRFKLTDYLTGKPVKGAEVSSGESNAKSDDQGVAALTIGKIESENLDVSISSGGYRTENVRISTTQSQPTGVTMVLSRKEVYVSKQSGKYDVFKVDIDGKNKQLLLAGTGGERDQITLVPHPTEELVALVSARDGRRNQDGYLLDTLTLINVTTGSALSLENSERIQIVNWAKDRLVYIKVKAGTSAGNPERSQLMSYNHTNTARLQLASANYFTGVIVAKGKIYYATSNHYQGGESQFVRINPDSTDKQVILSGQLWGVNRTSYDDIQISIASDFFTYRIGDSAAKKSDKRPEDANEARQYMDSPDGKRSLWTDARDGKGVLIGYDVATRKDKVIATQNGMGYPIRWLDNRTAIYRVAGPQETASYVVSTEGGTPKKIVDVTDVGGPGRWYF